MDNYKKILLIIGIIIFIVGLDLVLYFETDKLINNTQSYLGNLERYLNEKNFEDSKEAAEKLNSKWFEYEKSLSFFIEHDEIEKVSGKVKIVKENTKNKEYETALEDVVETKYLLEHIKDKYNFTLKNVF